MTIRFIFAAGVSAVALSLAAPALAQDAPAYPQMAFGNWGVDMTQIDPAVDPGADFNAYANGKWIAANDIPADRSRFGAFDFLDAKASENIAALIGELQASDPAPGTQERRLLDAYSAFMDTDAINAAGLAPAQPYLDAIGDAPDLKALTELSAAPGYPALVSAGVTVDERDPNSYIVAIGFSGMGLPDRDYYLVDNPANEAIRAQYKQFLAFMLDKAGYADPQAMAETVFHFEHQVAELEWARAMLRNPELTYNKLTAEQVEALVPEFPMAALLDASEFGEQPHFLVSQIPPTPELIDKLGLTAEQLASIGGGLPAMEELLLATPLDTLKAYLKVRFLSANASVLPSDIDAANFAFYGTALAGQPEQRVRWKRGISSLEATLGEQLGKLYVARYFPPESKAQMDNLVTYLRGAMRSFIEGNSWMTPETAEQAMAKLDSFQPMIGHPDTFKTYDGLTISPTDPLANRVSAIAWQVADNLSRLGKPVDKTEWGMLPQTINAYYNPVFNQVVFPAAILQPPFFNADADPAVNYGAIGAVIGHEMGHGFDDQGSQYDASGALRNWWAAGDRASFQRMAGKMSAFIEEYCPLDDGELCMTGGLALGETLGDVVGLQMAYRAYQMSLDGKPAPVIDGLTGDQRFFLGFAQVWREKIREEAQRNLIMSDPHPPAVFRINNTVRHLDAWYAAFDVKPGDPLYLAPEERISAW